MGADAGDLNNDGLIDFLITDMRDRNHAESWPAWRRSAGVCGNERVPDLIPQYMWNAVYLNTGTDHFAEAAHLTGMDATGWTWSARFGDLDKRRPARRLLHLRDDPQLHRRRPRRPAECRAQPHRARQRLEELAPRRENHPSLPQPRRPEVADVSKEWGLDHPGVSFGCTLADLRGRRQSRPHLHQLQRPADHHPQRNPTAHRVEIKLAGRTPNATASAPNCASNPLPASRCGSLYTERWIASSEFAAGAFRPGPPTR